MIDNKIPYSQKISPLIKGESKVAKEYTAETKKSGDKDNTYEEKKLSIKSGIAAILFHAASLPGFKLSLSYFSKYAIFYLELNFGDKYGKSN